MPSTYTTNNGIELIANGEQTGTWGDTTNDNLSIIDRLVTGVGSISLSGTTHTLTTTDGTLSDGMFRVLVFGGSPSGANTVTISPNTQQKFYVVRNNSGQSVVLTQGSGGNVTVANGTVKLVYADGAGASAQVFDLTGTLAMTAPVLGTPASGTVTNLTGTASININGTVGATTPTTAVVTTLTANTSVNTDTISEKTSAAGVTVDGVLLKDGGATFTGDITLNAQKDVRFADADSSNWVAFQGAGTIAANVTWTLPATDGTSGQLLSTNGTGTLSWATAGGGFTADRAIVSNGSGVLAVSAVTATELAYLDITTLGTTAASKAVTSDANGVTTFADGVNEGYTAVTVSSNAATLNFRDGNVFQLTLSGGNLTTFTWSNPPSSGTAYGFTLKVIQDSTARSITWPAAVDWPGGTAPTLSSANGAVDVFTFFTHDGGTTYYGFTSGKALA